MSDSRDNLRGEVRMSHGGAMGVGATLEDSSLVSLVTLGLLALTPVEQRREGIT